jgi:hypothetical protein
MIKTIRNIKNTHTQLALPSATQNNDLFKSGCRDNGPGPRWHEKIIIHSKVAGGTTVPVPDDTKNNYSFKSGCRDHGPRWHEKIIFNCRVASGTEDPAPNDYGAIIYIEGWKAIWFKRHLRLCWVRYIFGISEFFSVIWCI